jgi:oligopeptide/dipeptide ABC transporter ATP-binding protein
MALLEVQNLTVSVATEEGLYAVVQDVSFVIGEGQTMGLVGESGCGKSLTSLAIMGLLSHPQVQVTAGRIEFEGRNLLDLGAGERRRVMGSRMAMIFQEPMTSLNPVYTVGDQIVEALRQHRKVSTTDARKRVCAALAEVGIPEPEMRLKSYPHQLSGGLRQRVMIAMALVCEPVLLIADEPTTALDVTIQAQILDLLRELQVRNSMAILLISHDLGVIAEMTRRTAIMYRGRIVEEADTADIFADPCHPYTHGLLRSIPDPDVDSARLATIPGFVPSAEERIPGCEFHPRCPFAEKPVCLEAPDRNEISERHFLRCHYPLTTERRADAEGVWG